MFKQHLGLVISLTILLAGLATGVVLVRQQQIIQKQAAVNCPAPNNAYCTWDAVPADTPYFNGDYYIELVEEPASGAIRYIFQGNTSDTYYCFQATSGSDYSCRVTPRSRDPNACNFDPSSGSKVCQPPPTPPTPTPTATPTSGSQTCPFKTYAQIREGSQTGRLMTERDFWIDWQHQGVPADCRGQSGSVEFNNASFDNEALDILNGQIVTHVDLSQCTQGGTAIVSLRLAAGWRIKENYIGAGQYCCEVGTGATISGMNLSCGATYTYGWVLERIPPTPTVPVVTPTPTPGDGDHCNCGPGTDFTPGYGGCGEGGCASTQKPYYYCVNNCWQAVRCDNKPECVSVQPTNTPYQIPTIGAGPTLPWTIPSRRSADLNKDGRIDAVDSSLILKAWGKSSGEEGFNSTADLDSSQRIDALDVSILMSQIGSTVTETSGLAPIPTLTPTPLPFWQRILRGILGR